MSKEPTVTEIQTEPNFRKALILKTSIINDEKSVIFRPKSEIAWFLFKIIDC